MPLFGLNRIAVITLTILLFEHCTTVTLTRVTQQRTDKARANPTVVVFLTEICKLVLAMTLELTAVYGLGSSSTPSAVYAQLFSRPMETLRVSVPAFLYTIQNISIFVALGNLEVVTFQVLYQTKLMLTAVLSVLFLSRRLTPRQWASLVALTIGVIAVELSDASLQKPAEPAEKPQDPSGRLLASRLGPTSRELRHLATTSDEAALAGLWRAGALSAAAPRWLPFRDDADERRRLQQKTGVKKAAGGRESKHHGIGVSKHGSPRKGKTAEPYSSDGAASTASADKSSPDTPPPSPSSKNGSLGLAAALLAATLSSFAGVYFEGLVKGKEPAPPTLWMRNIQLCLFTIPLAGVAVLGQMDAVRRDGLAHGLDGLTWLLIGLNASGGLLVAAVIKYGDSILKNFTTSCSVILGTLISVWLFDFQLSTRFLWGSTLVVISAFAYASAPPYADGSPDKTLPASPARDDLEARCTTYGRLSGAVSTDSTTPSDDASDSATAPRAAPSSGR